jgi:uncharacterized RDD family membrane protein YckC
MTQQIPAGWYADPAPAEPGRPPQQRYWDGQQWTEHLAPAGGPSGGQAAGPTYGPPPATTPDGQRLSGWWMRVWAYLLDALVVFSLATAIGWPFMHKVVNAYSDFFSQAVRAAENGTTPPSQSDLLSQIAGPLAGFVAVYVAVSFVYQVGFLKTLQATPGKLALGLRVRLRERPGPMSWGTVILRWLVQNAASFVSVIPVLGTVAGLYPLLDGLWPLWDEKKQALHDKAARTNVVRVRG